MFLFIYTLMAIVVIYIIRYILVHIQCRRAIKYANYLSIDHVYKCAEAFANIRKSDLFEEQKNYCSDKIKRVLNKSDIYFEKYYEDFDFNHLWLSVDKWTLRQMFPNLTNMKRLKVTYED